jgi:DNA topoisomerase-1
MAKSLIIVESPAKTKSLKAYLGSDYDVEASVGHIRDLPKSWNPTSIDAPFDVPYEVTKDRLPIPLHVDGKPPRAREHRERRQR